MIAKDRWSCRSARDWSPDQKFSRKGGGATWGNYSMHDAILIGAGGRVRILLGARRFLLPLAIINNRCAASLIHIRRVILRAVFLINNNTRRLFTDYPGINKRRESRFDWPAADGGCWQFIRPLLPLRPSSGSADSLESILKGTYLKKKEKINKFETYKHMPRWHVV